MTLRTEIAESVVQFAGHPDRARELMSHLGFEPIEHPVDLLRSGVSGLREFFDVRDDRFGVRELYRVGSQDAQPGTVAAYVAVLEGWGTRSSDRDRARRRVARALVELAADSRTLFFLVPNELERSAVSQVELILPRPPQPRDGQDSRGALITVRALIDVRHPDRFHRELLEQLVMAPGSTLATVSRQWQAAFSVERVTKAFYQEYQDVRDSIAEALVVANPENESIRALSESEQRAWATRQLGRVLFLWFLQSKRWLGGDGSGEGRADYLIDLWRRRDVERGYFRGMLSPLFFEGMAKRNPGPVIRQQLEYTPYLNGGLFRPSAVEDRIDAVGEIELPDELFDPTSEHSVLGFLSRYRFTTRESTPDDQSVDPDPELLGRVFENLYQGDERHDSGTYYTPREIVHFMCRQALDGYLADACGVDQDTIDWLRREVVDPDASDRKMDPEAEEQLHAALDSVRVCDPAVGSGAFLLGMMQEIVQLRRGMAHAKNDFTEVADERVADWKRRAIQNSLYGVDINPEAVEICQLRLWLSLVLDMQSPRETEPLPNLDFRIVAGDSLIDRAAGIPFSESLPRGVYQPPLDLGRRVGHEEEQIEKWRNEFERTQENPKRLRELRENIFRASKRIVRHHLDAAMVTARAEADAAKEKARRDGLSESEARRRERNSERSHERLAKLESTFEGLEPEAPYQKPFLWPVAFSEVFRHGGFDIVLANPPYVRQERLAAEDQDVYEEVFPEVYSGTADILVFFYARAWQILRDGGWLAFITSNKFTRADYGQGLRKLLRSEFRLEHVLDFGHIPVFEADVYPLVVTATRKTSTSADRLMYTRLREPIRDALVRRSARVNSETVREELEQIGAALEENGHEVSQHSLDEGPWSFPTIPEAELLQYLRLNPTKVADVLGEHTYRGLLTGLNEAFVIDDSKRAELIESDPRSEEVIWPWIRGRDIHQWQVASSDRYVIVAQNSGDADASNPWSGAETEDEALSLFSTALPAIHQHLSKWEEYPDPQRKERLKGLRPRGDQGRYWWELRPCTYYWAFDRPKVVWRDVSYLPKFAWDESHAVLGNSGFVSADAPRWFVAYGNSQLFAWLASHELMEGKDAYFRWLPSDIASIPVPHFDEAARARLDGLVETVHQMEDEACLERVEEDVNGIVFAAARLTSYQRSLVEAWYAERLRTETLGSIERMQIQ